MNQYLDLALRFYEGLTDGQQLLLVVGTIVGLPALYLLFSGQVVSDRMVTRIREQTDEYAKSAIIDAMGWRIALTLITVGVTAVCALIFWASYTGHL